MRAINLTSGCGQFLDAINANGGSLTKATIIDILKVAKTNISGDVACYNRVATFLNGVRQVQIANQAHLRFSVLLCSGSNSRQT